MIPAVTLTKEHELTGVGVVQRTMGAKKVFLNFSKLTQKKIQLFPDSEANMYFWPWTYHNVFVFYPGNPVMPLIIQ